MAVEVRVPEQMVFVYLEQLLLPICEQTIKDSKEAHFFALLAFT
ncbi:hypothetical protein DB29_01987 [Shouchella clausii]|nr:hypothetical protein DB29_01987 [Shouchella clausii]